MSAVAFLPFGPFVCAGSLDKSVSVFHILTGEQKFTLSAHSSGITSLAVSSDGILVSGSNDGDVRVWDLRLHWSEEMGTLVSCCKDAHSAPITRSDLIPVHNLTAPLYRIPELDVRLLRETSSLS